MWRCRMRELRRCDGRQGGVAAAAREDHVQRHGLSDLPAARFRRIFEILDGATWGVMEYHRFLMVKRWSEKTLSSDQHFGGDLM